MRVYVGDCETVHIMSYDVFNKHYIVLNDTLSTDTVIL